MSLLKIALWVAMVGLFATSATWAQTPIKRQAADFDRCQLRDPTVIPKIKETGTLSANQGSVDGWFEYDFTADQTGWYELIVHPNSSNIEYFIDQRWYQFSQTNDAKVGNVWLAAGKHTLRIQRQHWTGIPKVTDWALMPSDGSIGKSMHVRVADDRTIVRRGESVKLLIETGNRAEPVTLTAVVINAADNKPVGGYPVDIAASKDSQTTALTIPCDAEGFYVVQFTCAGQAITKMDAAPITLTVIDTTAVPHAGGELKKELVREIDCAQAEPDYSGGGATRVIRKPFGAYRETNDVGWLDHMNSKDPSWFAYKVEIDSVQQPYVVEVDYPDDAKRTFCIAVRESKMVSYPVATGVDCGGEFSLSNKMLTNTAVIYPRAKDLRILLVQPLTGMRAAAAKIRVYKVNGDLPLLDVPVRGGRDFGDWFEEGSSYVGMYGVSHMGYSALADSALAGDRWAHCVAYMGGSTLWYTPVVYQFGMYPSRYNIQYTALYSPDTIRVMLMKCEKYGLQFISEFHPEARELAYPSPRTPDPARALMVSKDGRLGRLPWANSAGASFDPLYPPNQEWYLGMIGEFCDRYKDSPALEGVSLRLMDWCNPSLNNFHSMDWGYNDATLALFEKDTGIQVPVTSTGPERFRLRYDWLTIHERDKWRDWRCDKITELHARIRDRIHQARPDLKLYLNMFSGTQFPDDLRDMGIDVRRLSELDGVILVNARYPHGRHYWGMKAAEHRDYLINPAKLKSLSDTRGRGSFLFGAVYFEATEVIVPPKDLGFPANTLATWMSAVVDPAGRQALEHWALALAECDTAFISDGGNTYTLGQPVLRDFLREYRHLPPDPFNRRADATDPVAVWELAKDGGLWFYAVNMERYPVSTRIAFRGDGKVIRVSLNEAAPLSDHVMTMDLEPYELRCFRADKSMSIEKVSVTVPPEQLEMVTTQVTWLEQLATDAQSKEGLPGAAFGQQHVKTIVDSANQARAALDAGHLWLARTTLNHAALYEVYELCNRWPPMFRDNGAPVPPVGAATAGQLRTAAQPADQLQVVTSESVCPLWVGQKLLTTDGASLKINVDVPFVARYRLVVGRVAGGDYGLLDVVSDGKVVGTLNHLPDSVSGIESVLTDFIALSKGTNTIEFRRKTGSRIAVAYVDVSPVFTDLTGRFWQTVGPFAGSAKDVAATMAHVYPPEAATAPLDFAQTFTDNGVTLRWQTLEKDRDFVSLSDRQGLGVGQIGFAVTHIKSPITQTVRIKYGMDYWMKIHLNGKLIVDKTERPGGAPYKGQFEDDITLQQGVNELRVKVMSGSGGNGFWLAISDPGTLSFERPTVGKPTP